MHSDIYAKHIQCNGVAYIYGQLEEGEVCLPLGICAFFYM